MGRLRVAAHPMPLGVRIQVSWPGRSGGGRGHGGVSGMGEGLGLKGRASLVWGLPVPPVLTELSVAVWAGEEGAELEEEEVEEEEEESGNLDEEEIKKMQSDEVCGESSGGAGVGLGSVLASSLPSPSSLGHSGPGGDGLQGDVQPSQLHPAHQVHLLRVLCP